MLKMSKSINREPAINNHTPAIANLLKAGHPHIEEIERKLGLTEKDIEEMEGKLELNVEDVEDEGSTAGNGVVGKRTFQAS